MRSMALGATRSSVPSAEPGTWATSDTPGTSSTAADSCQAPSTYERYADVFSRAYADTHSIAIALEVLDTFRAREVLTRPADHDLPKRVLAIAASLFHVPAKQLLERNRRADVTSARYVAAWVLRRRRWSYARLASCSPWTTRRSSMAYEGSPPPAISYSPR